MRASSGTGRYIAVGCLEKRGVDDRGHLEVLVVGHSLNGKRVTCTLKLDKSDQRTLAFWVAENHKTQAIDAELAREGLQSAFHTRIAKP